VVATVSVLLAVGFSLDDEPTVNSRFELTVATNRLQPPAKGHGFIRAVSGARDSFFVAFRPCSAAKADEEEIVVPRCGTTKVVPFHRA